MGLFNRIPATFFSVLASPNRQLYWAALTLLHQELEYSLTLPLDDYRSALAFKLEDLEFSAEPDLTDEDQTLFRQPNGKANLIINRLLRAGWLDKEYREGTFVEIIAPRDYADKMIRLLLELEQFEGKEYNSLVYSTYTALTQAYAERSEHLYEALLTAKRNTSELLRDLKSLYHNIRYYHQLVGQAPDVNGLLHDYYDEYKKLLDRIYHPIKTMDSIYHYRDPILDILSALRVDDELQTLLLIRAQKMQEGTSPEALRETLLADLNYLTSSYQSIDDILYEIDRKHRAYTRESVDSIKYRMTADHSIRGKLSAILSGYAQLPPGEEQDAWMCVMQQAVQCETQAFADSTSPWHPNVRSQRVNTPALPIQELAPDAEQELVHGMQADLRRQYSILRARTYITQALGEKDAMTSDELELNADSEFILLLLATVRSTDRGSPFTIEFLDGQTQKNGYSVPKMRFIRRR